MFLIETNKTIFWGNYSNYSNFFPYLLSFLSLFTLLSNFFAQKVWWCVKMELFLHEIYK